MAAAKHLRDLFVNFQDWHLALAAYNAGSGAVNKVMTSEGETDFWELSRNGRFPRETRKFVPRVIALSMIFSDPSRYGFENARVVG
jgi:membrane-bound lytic murein transglycosylase D